jgi:hypothetical protein
MIAVIRKYAAQQWDGGGFSFAWLTGSQQEAALAFNDYNLQVKKHPYSGAGRVWGLASELSPPQRRGVSA